jgi:hypothetical protein
MTSRRYDAIDERVAVEIKRLHKEHPKLGHHGLLEALRQDDIHIDPHQLEQFMRVNHILPEREWRPWRWRGLPRWWLSGGRWGAGIDPEDWKIGDK